MKHLLVSLLLIVAYTTIFAQQTKRVLFLGNSYTAGNNLPQMLADVASSLGDSLIFDSNTPGGHTMLGHSANATSQAKIAQGGWDYVVIQEQSQLPSFPWSQFSTASLPYADSLCRKIREADSCAIPLFFMTWGRKNGDQMNCATWPPVCTYAGMQHLLRERYVLMADTNNAKVAPVGAVWRDVRNDSLGIELYAADGSHPSMEGSYLAACTFYASIFHKSPVGASALGFMWPQDALAIQQHAEATVFDSLGVWMIDTLKPQVNFAWTQTSPNCEITFDASFSQYVDSVYWDFGDGTAASGINVQHTYAAGGTYTVCAEGWKGCIADSFCQTWLFCAFDVDENELQGITIYPNPSHSIIRVEHFDQPALNAAFSVYDLQGKLLLKGEDASVIDVSALATGVYILEIRIGERVSRLRFEKI
jgi:hypothetical protein